MAYYLVPKEGDGLTLETAFRPKYLDGLSWSARDFGDWFLVQTDDPNDLQKQIDVVVLGEKGEVLGDVLGSLKVAGFPVNGFTGTTVDELLAFIHPIILVKQAANGLANVKHLDAQTIATASANLEIQRETLLAQPGVAADLAAFLAETDPVEVVKP